MELNNDPQEVKVEGVIGQFFRLQAGFLTSAQAIGKI